MRTVNLMTIFSHSWGWGKISISAAGTACVKTPRLLTGLLLLWMWLRAADKEVWKSQSRHSPSLPFSEAPGSSGLRGPYPKLTISSPGLAVTALPRSLLGEMPVPHPPSWFLALSLLHFLLVSANVGKLDLAFSDGVWTVCLGLTSSLSFLETGTRLEATVSKVRMDE